MGTRSLLIEALGQKQKEFLHWPEGVDAYEAPADEDFDESGAPAPEIDEIFATIRTGDAPWDVTALPEDTGATGVLLTELDRLWQNPLG